MKKVLALMLAVIMCVSLAACGTDTAEPAADPGTDAAVDETVDETGDTTEPTDEDTAGGEATADEFSGDVTLQVMLMPQDSINSDATAQVTEAVNARIAELGYQFKVEFSWSSGAGWLFDNLDIALQSGSAPDIFPAHAWSGTVNYLVGAQNGQYVRLDNPENNLLEKYAPALYANASPLIAEAATVNGDQGMGIYGYIIEKDSVSQLGYLVNVTALEEIGFTLDDFVADDITTWEPLLQAYVDANPGKYPLNIEGEVLDRTVNHIVYINNPIGPLGVEFDNANPAGTEISMINRYKSSGYQNMLATMRSYYEAGFVDPDQGVVGDVSATSVANRRTSGDFLISTYVYAPGNENMVAQSASDAQGKDIQMAFVPGWSKPIGTVESAQGSGLAISASSQYVPEAATFLNMLASDQVIGDLVAEGVEGVSVEYKDGIAWRIGDRAGWNVWRYGVVGPSSAATPLGDVEANGAEWTNFLSFNGSADLLSFGLFNAAEVDAENSASIAVIDKYAVPLASGALDPAEYDAFMEELTAVGVDAVVEAAQLQFEEFKASQQ